MTRRDEVVGVVDRISRFLPGGGLLFGLRSQFGPGLRGDVLQLRPFRQHLLLQVQQVVAPLLPLLVLTVPARDVFALLFVAALQLLLEAILSFGTLR